MPHASAAAGACGNRYAPQYAPGAPPAQMPAARRQSIVPWRAYSQVPTAPLPRYANMHAGIAVCSAMPPNAFNAGGSSTPPIPAAPMSAPTPAAAAKVTGVSMRKMAGRASLILRRGGGRPGF